MLACTAYARNSESRNVVFTTRLSAGTATDFSLIGLSFARYASASFAFYDESWFGWDDASASTRFIRESVQVQGRIQGLEIGVVES